MLKISFSRILVKLVDTPKNTEIYLPTDENECLLGEVLAVGDGRNPKSGKIVPMDVVVGDTVMFSAHIGEKLEQGLLFNESDVLAIV